MQLDDIPDIEEWKVKHWGRSKRVSVFNKTHDGKSNSLSPSLLLCTFMKNLEKQENHINGNYCNFNILGRCIQKVSVSSILHRFGQMRYQTVRNKFICNILLVGFDLTPLLWLMDQNQTGYFLFVMCLWLTGDAANIALRSLQFFRIY